MVPSSGHLKFLDSFGKLTNTFPMCTAYSTYLPALDWWIFPISPTRLCTGFRFSAFEKCHFKEHVKLVHKKKKTIECTICEFSTFKRYHLRRHMNEKHNIKRDPICLSDNAKI